MYRYPSGYRSFRPPELHPLGFPFTQNYSRANEPFNKLVEEHEIAITGLTRRTCVVHRVVVAGKRRESNDETETENKGRYRESNYKRVASFRTLFLFLAVLNFFEPIPSLSFLTFHFIASSFFICLNAFWNFVFTFDSFL